MRWLAQARESCSARLAPTPDDAAWQSCTAGSNCAPSGPRAIRQSLQNGSSSAAQQLELEAAFAASGFRDALLPHVGLLTLGTAGLGVAYGAYASSQDLVAMVLALLMLVFRVYIHQHTEAQKAQKLGTACWTLGVVTTVLNDIAFLWGSTDAQQLEAACGAELYSPYLAALIGFVIGMVNGTHGMGFWHKTALVAVMSVEALLFALWCSHADGSGVYERPIDMSKCRYGWWLPRCATTAGTSRGVLRLP